MTINSLAAPELSEYWSLREDTHTESGAGPEGPLVVRTPDGELRVPRPSGLLREAVRRMLLGSVSLRNVVDDFPRYDTPSDAVGDDARALLAELAQLSSVTVRTLALGAEPLLSVVPLLPGARFAPQPCPDPGRARLIESAVVRYEDGWAALEAPGVPYRVEFHRPEAFRLLGRLDTRAVHDPAGLLTLPRARVPERAVDAVTAYLAGVGLVEGVEAGEETRHLRS
ncbi:hypothetical protein [Streptomyces sp. ICBB 8177]|uniref:hypothetical protein n=1 Tax=Streptomyces sp. ICBB 8177 TaxID=563922 RepID=UPI000D67CB50|nr:hypothetical protein [Streptomyces sp. ICBB 8177]PWI45349.1 hypothetical protein CK485_04205 [Streptomyces sp. ICBB 8177]